MRLLPGYYLEATVGGEREWFSLGVAELPAARNRANTVLEERRRIALVSWAERRARNESLDEQAGAHVPLSPHLLWVTKTNVYVYIPHTFPYPTGSGDLPA